MNYYLALCLIILYWVAFPIYYVLTALLSILLLILSPLLHLAHYFAYACWYPISLIPNFETLYIFVGVAVIVGAATGLTIHFASRLITDILRLDHPFEEPRGRTLQSYRAEKQERQDKKDPLAKLIRETVEAQETLPPVKDELRDWVKREQSRGRRNGMIPNTILEEDDDTSEAGF